MKDDLYIQATIGLKNLLDVLPEAYTQADRDLIARAYHTAEVSHQFQKRASGEPYVNHCIAVAMILAEMRVPPDVVAAGNPAKILRKINEKDKEHWNTGKQLYIDLAKRYLHNPLKPVSSHTIKTGKEIHND